MARFVEHYLIRLQYQMPLALLGWGLWVFFLHPFDTSVTFRQMETIASEAVWGGLFIVLGTGGIAGSVVAERRPLCRRCRLFALLGSAGVATGWFFIDLVLTIANPMTTAVFTYAYFFIMSLLSFLDLAGVFRWRQYRAGNY